MNIESLGRISAGWIAAVAWFGLTLQCVVLCSPTSSLLHALWIMAAYFTISTNVLVALVFTGAALDQQVLRSNFVIAGTMLSILLVGVIYAFLLHGLVELSGGSSVANVVLHRITPVLVPVFWILFPPKNKLQWRDPFLWAIYPLTYLGYALARGGVTGSYAYPFLNVPAIGWPQTLMNAICIAAAFMLSGFALVWLDGRLGRSSASSSRLHDQN